MSIIILQDDGTTDNRVPTLTQLTRQVTYNITLRNDYASTITSLKAYLVNNDTLPGTRSVVINGIEVTGTDEASATELLTEPLPAGGTLSGVDTCAGPSGDWVLGTDIADLYFLSLLEG